MTWGPIRDALRRQGWLLIIGAVIGASSGGYMSERIAAPSTTTVRILVNHIDDPGRPGEADLTYSIQLAASYAAAFKAVLRDSVALEAFVRPLDFPISSQEVRGWVTILHVPRTPTVEITSTYPDHERAAVITTRLADFFIRSVEQTRIAVTSDVHARVARDVDEARRQLAITSARLDELRANPQSGANAEMITLLHRRLLEEQARYLSLLPIQEQVNLEQIQARASTELVILEVEGIPPKGVSLRTVLHIVLSALVGCALQCIFVVITALRGQVETASARALAAGENPLQRR